MPYNSITAVLNHILVTIETSFSMYLSYAAPYFSKDDEAARAEFSNLIADQNTYIKKLGEAIIERNERPANADFPMDFTGTHDLSAKYLLKETVRLHAKDTDTITAAVKHLRSDPAAFALGEEILGNARGHLESMREIVARPAVPRVLPIT
jgi:hypothetical protein